MTKGDFEVHNTEIMGTNHITLKRSTKGIYSWEIKVYNDNPLPQLEKLDLELKKKYTGEIIGARSIGKEGLTYEPINK